MSMEILLFNNKHFCEQLNFSNIFMILQDNIFSLVIIGWLMFLADVFT